MFVIEDADFEDAEKRLRLTGFDDSPCSCFSVHPSFHDGDAKANSYRMIVREFSNLAGNSGCFFFHPE
jgi:hypothetical protein